MPGADDDKPTETRVGSYADLSRRVDRLEGSVSGLLSSVKTVELNQTHAETVNNLRFDALDKGQASLEKLITGFIARIEGIIDGSVQTHQTRQGEKVMADYLSWRAKVDSRLPPEDLTEWRDTVDAFMTQGKFLGRLAVLLVSTNIIAIVVAVGAALNAAGRP